MATTRRAHSQFEGSFKPENPADKEFKMGRSSKFEGAGLANLIRSTRVMGADEASSYHAFIGEQQKSEIYEKHLEDMENYLIGQGKATPGWCLVGEANRRVREYKKIIDVLPHWAFFMDDCYDKYWKGAKSSVENYNKLLNKQIEERHDRIETECNSSEFRKQKDAFKRAIANA